MQSGDEDMTPDLVHVVPIGDDTVLIYGHCIVTDWDGMNKIRRHTFIARLPALLVEYSVLLTEASSDLKRNREKDALIPLETSNVSKTHMLKQAVLSLHASAWTANVVPTAGCNSIQTVLTYERHIITNCDDIGKIWRHIFVCELWAFFFRSAESS